MSENDEQCCGNCGWGGSSRRADEVVCHAPVSDAAMKRIDKVSPYYHMRRDWGANCEAWKPKPEEEVKQ